MNVVLGYSLGLSGVVIIMSVFIKLWLMMDTESQANRDDEYESTYTRRGNLLKIKR